MMCNRENDNAISLRTINNGKPKIPDNDAPGVTFRRRTRERESQCARGRFLDGGGKARALPRLGLVIVGDLGKKLGTRRRNESRPFHRASRLASAKTSSAEMAFSSPRS